jgi:hypothetical protein
MPFAMAALFGKALVYGFREPPQPIRGSVLQLAGADVAAGS